RLADPLVVLLDPRGAVHRHPTVGADGDKQRNGQEPVDGIHSLDPAFAMERAGGGAMTTVAPSELVAQRSAWESPISRRNDTTVMTQPLISWNASALLIEVWPNIQTVGTSRKTLLAIATNGLAMSSNARSHGRSGSV